MEERVPRIAVIGAGVSGLSTVWCLKRELPQAGITDFKITMFADRILNGTLSNGAGGVFRVDPRIGVSRETNDEWALLSFQHFADLAHSPAGNEAGVRFVTGVHVSSRSAFSMEHMSAFCPDLRPLTEQEIRQLLPACHRFKYGYEYTTLITDPRRYLKWLLVHALTTCDLVIRSIASLEQEEILSSYDVIVNCTALGARLLAHDQSLTAIRGQTIRVHAPHITRFTWADGAYVYPMGDGMVTLGGIKQLDREDTAVDPEDKDWIWRRCTELEPSLKECPIQQEWVGLRPFRQPIRVQKEVLPNGRIVVHNYGHGGNGYTYCMGTAMEATKLVIHTLEPVSQNSSEHKSKL